MSDRSGAPPGGPGTAPVPATTTRSRLPQALRLAAVHATLAPSVYRTEPWRLVLGERALQIYADRSRQLRALDPVGRQLVISCGRALANAQTTITAARHRALVERLPDAREPDLLARLTLGGPGGSSAPDHLDTPDDAVELRVVTDPDQLILVGRLDRLALLEQEADPARLAELRAWRTPPRTPDDRLHNHETVVLGTPHDTPLDWLRTGEALQRLESGSWRDFSVRLLPHLVESSRAREQLRVGLELDAHPQAVLLLGPPTSFSPSRNRRLVDVLSVSPGAEDVA